MGYVLNADRLNAEIQRYLEKGRIPERRMWDNSGNVLTSSSVCRGPEEFRELYERANKLDGWPGDKWQEPIGHHRNPFLRQSKNLSLAAIILSDPHRQQEAFDKLLEAGYKSDSAKEILAKYHDTVCVEG
jgi:hypothetical protein